MVGGGRLVDYLAYRQIHDRGAVAGVPVEVDYAGEFRYRQPPIDERTLVIAVSQSGETADTLAAMEEGGRRGAI